MATPLFGTFGNVNASKRIPQLLEAFADVRRRHEASGLLLVGATSPGFDLDRRLQRLGLDGAGLVREGYVDERRLWALMAAADVHVNLRSPTMGETSGTAIRALSLGEPLIVSDVGWFSELPDDVALKVPVDDRRGRDAHRRARAARDARGRARRRWARRRASSPAASTTSTASPSSTSPRSSRQPVETPSAMRCSARSARQRPRSGSRRARPRRSEIAARLAEVELGG